MTSASPATYTLLFDDARVNVYSSVLVTEQDGVLYSLQEDSELMPVFGVESMAPPLASSSTTKMAWPTAWVIQDLLGPTTQASNLREIPQSCLPGCRSVGPASESSANEPDLAQRHQAADCAQKQPDTPEFPRSVRQKTESYPETSKVSGLRRK